MKTKVVCVNPNSFEPSELLEAAKEIQSGNLVAFPTETVYGLGACALNSKACDAIFDAKGRPHDNPLIVHVLTPEDCSRYADTSSVLFSKLAKRFMPGPLTIILPKKPIIPDTVTVGLETVALRCPSHPVARALLELSGVPIAAPSANLSGRPSPTRGEHVIEDMFGRISMIINGGDSVVGLESTVISLKGDTIYLLRPGFVTLDDLKEITPNVVVSHAVLHALDHNEKPESPGMKYRHYAPKAPVTIVKGDEEKVLQYFRDALAKGFGVICFDEDLPFLESSDKIGPLFSIGPSDDVQAQAYNLFDILRKMDAFELKHIYARSTQQDKFGLALSNRLLRACAFQIIEV